MNKSVIEEISEIQEFLPKKQRQLCHYILTNQTHVSMMTVAELAQNAGVGTTTVLRLVEQLRFESYNAFKRALLEDSITKGSSAYQQMKNSFLRPSDKAGALPALCDESIKSYGGFLTAANLEAFEQAVKMLLGAKRVHILGMRSSAALALYLESSLHLFMPNVHQLSFQQQFLYDRLLAITPDEVLLTVSVWPCTKLTVDAAELCHQRGVPVILLTNTRINPIAKFADVTIDTNSIGQSSTPVMLMTAIQALVDELGRRAIPQSSEALEKLEKQLAEHHLILWEQNS